MGLGRAQSYLLLAGAVEMTSAGERSVRRADDDERGTASAKRPLRFDVVDSAPIHNCRYSRVWFGSGIGWRSSRTRRKWPGNERKSDRKHQGKKKKDKDEWSGDKVKSVLNTAAQLTSLVFLVFHSQVRDF
jgi:hypothetical protein